MQGKSRWSETIMGSQSLQRGVFSIIPATQVGNRNSCGTFFSPAPSAPFLSKSYRRQNTPAPVLSLFPPKPTTAAKRCRCVTWRSRDLLPEQAIPLSKPPLQSPPGSPFKLQIRLRTACLNLQRLPIKRGMKSQPCLVSHEVSCGLPAALQTAPLPPSLAGPSESV